MVGFVAPGIGCWKGPMPASQADATIFRPKSDSETEVLRALCVGTWLCTSVN